MADVRRTKRSRLSRDGVEVEPAGTTRDDDASAREPSGDEEGERALARMFALGLPLVGILGALVVGSVLGLPPALLVLAGTALLGTIGFFWASLRTLSGDAPLPEGIASRAHASRVPAAERKRETLRALKDLEFEHAIGKIDDADFKELQGRYRGTAKALMREMDEGLAPRREEAERLVSAYLAKKNLAPAKRPAPLAEAPESMPEEVEARRACPKCATSNEPDAAFCKKCGSPLAKGDVPDVETSDASV